MQISISNSVGGYTIGSSGGAVEEQTVYKLGAEGNIDGGIIFHHYTPYWYESYPTQAFYDIDPISISIGDLVTYTIDDVEALFSGDTVANTTGWIMLEEPSSTQVGFQGFATHEYSSSQPIMDSFMSESFLNQIYLDLIPLVIASSHNKVRIVYKEYNSVSYLEYNIPSLLGDLSSVLKSSSWTRNYFVPTIPIGFILADEHAKLQSGQPLIKYYSPRCIKYLSEGEPPAVPVPPSQLNVYDTGGNALEFPAGILPQNILAYGDILQPQRLSNTVDRYRESYKLQDVINPAKGSYSEIGTKEESQSLVNTNIVTTRTRNFQVNVKVYIVQQGIPPSPWYTTQSGETLYAKAKFNCYQNSQRPLSIVDVSTVYPYQPEIVSSATTYTDSWTINGINYYVALHSFDFDVSNVLIYLTEAQRTFLGTTDYFAPATSLAYIGSQDPNVAEKMRAMLFEFAYLKFDTNLKSTTRNLATTLKTGKSIVVPTIGGSIAVGAAAGGYILSSSTGGGASTGAQYLSMRPAYSSPSEVIADFSYEFNSSSTQNRVFNAPGVLGGVVKVEFDNKLGAISDGSVFKYVDAIDQTTHFTGTIDASLDLSAHPLSPSAQVELQLVLNDNEIISLGTPVVNTVGTVDNYTWTVDYTHTFSGEAGWTILEKAYFRFKVNNLHPSEFAAITLKSGSNIDASKVTYNPAAPTSNPAYVGPPPAPIQRFNSYY